MIARIQQQIARSAHVDRLRALAGDAAPGAPVSFSFTLAAEPGKLLDLLPEQGVFWYQAQPARQHYRLGIGHALAGESHGSQRFAQLDEMLSSLSHDWRRNDRALAFTGFAFASTPLPPWPNAMLAIPAILIEASEQQCTVTLSCTAGALQAGTVNFPPWPTRPASPLPAWQQHADDDDRQAWLARVDQALRSIEAGRLEKLVLARALRLQARHDFPTSTLLHRLVNQRPESCIYAFCDGQRSFLGATPERLLTLQAGRITADALAGTAWPGSQALSSDKNLREQALVSQAVRESIAGFSCQPPQPGATGIHNSGQLSHLHNTIVGQAKPGVTLFKLLAAVHPTPAVGGYPQDAALSWLSAHHEQRPAWYSGGIGHLAPDGSGEIHVALRSAFIDGRNLELHAGAGIVRGSEAELELAETQAKLGTLLDILDCHLDEILVQQNDGLAAYT